jgi:hypothetical protein
MTKNDDDDNDENDDRSRAAEEKMIPSRTALLRSHCTMNYVAPTTVSHSVTALDFGLDGIWEVPLIDIRETSSCRRTGKIPTAACYVTVNFVG